MKFLCILFVCLSVSVGFVRTYKPVIAMHGIIAAASEYDTLLSWLEKVHPGTETFAVDLYDHMSSVVNMMEQVDVIKDVMSKYMQKYPDGVHMICFSQGGLLCRGVLEHILHNVDTFISLSSPQAGQFGDTDFTKFLFPHLLRDQIYRIAYTPLGQNISVGNYWNDPHHQDLYLKASEFLAVLNNDSYNARADEFKSNFLRLKKLVMIGGPDDGVIMPWQSSQFGVYDENENIKNMTETKWYTQDTFGLQTLAKRGGLVFHTHPGVFHTNWLKTQEVFEKYILPYLT